MIQFIKKFMAMEAAGGIVLMVVAVAAMLVANSPVATDYALWVKLLHLPINDGLMVLFFLLVGLEIKREMVDGELSTVRQAALPVIGALGGVVLPALIYAYFNKGTPELRGWAIPCATDIAFSLGVLSLFGSRVSLSLKIFLMALAVIDDLVAVLIIAIFYTSELVIPALGVALCAVLALWHMNRSGVTKIFPYLIVGGFLWAAILQSGVHATIAGVLLGLLIPAPQGKKCIENLHGWVAFAIMPLFAFANAGVPLKGIAPDQLLDPVPMGIIAGLFLGKQFGIFAFSFAAVKLKLADKPQSAGWLEFYAVAMIAGIGFTMSLFVGTLAFFDPAMLTQMRLGVLAGSFLSALFGCLLLALALRLRLSKP